MTRHTGKEFGFVITGSLTVTVNFDDYVLYPVWVVVGRHCSSSSEPI